MIGWLSGFFPPGFHFCGPWFETPLRLEPHFGLSPTSKTEYFFLFLGSADITLFLVSVLPFNIENNYTKSFCNFLFFGDVTVTWLSHAPSCCTVGCVFKNINILHSHI